MLQMWKKGPYCKVLQELEEKLECNERCRDSHGLRAKDTGIENSTKGI